jgi:hypothetical protein
MNDQASGSVNGQYPPPSPANADQSSQSAPAFKLFDANAVAIATFLGSPVAGSILMAINYRRLGKGGSAAVAVVLGVVSTAAAVVLGYFVPTTFTTAVAVILVVTMRSVAQALQGSAVKQHVGHGGSLGSKWAASGVGLIFLVVVAGAIFGGILLFEMGGVLQSNVVIGTKDKVYCVGPTTKEQAKTLGSELQKIGYFSDRGATVFLAEGKGSATVVSFAVKDGAWTQPATIAAFEEIGREIAPSVGGFPLKVLLVNTAGDKEKELNVGRVAVGAKDEIYFYGSAVEADAKALGQSLKSAQFFQDRGVTVFLAKNDDGTAISFIVGDGVWDDPKMVAGFETLVRQAAPSVGRLPIKFRLLSTELETKKEVTVN